MIHYDQKLISDAQLYFSRLYGRAITHEEAESFLKSFVELFNSLSSP